MAFSIRSSPGHHQKKVTATHAVRSKIACLLSVLAISIAVPLLRLVAAFAQSVKEAPLLEATFLNELLYTHRRDPRRVRRPEHLRQFSSSFYDDYLIERLSAIGFGRPSNAGGAGKVGS